MSPYKTPNKALLYTYKNLRMTRYLIFAFLFLALSCGSQNSVHTNKIFNAAGNKFGVMSKSGKLLIDSIYHNIYVLHDKARKILPPREGGPTSGYKFIEYYLVRNDKKELAVFDHNGKIIFDFVECYALEIDESTQTIVKIMKEKNNELRSYLYNFNNQQLFEESFEDIGFVNNSNLIALIKEDGYKDEYYLYNTKSKVKIGPFNHMNFYTKDSSPPLGMAEEQYAKYKNLNVIFIRQKNESENVWGVVNMEGKELLPIKYKKITIIDDDTYKAVIEKATKPENVIFYFYTYSLDESSKLLLLDREMNFYKYDQATKTIHKLK